MAKTVPEILFVCVQNAGRSQMAAAIAAHLAPGKVCPVYSGKRYEDWDVADPDGQPLSVILDLRDDLTARVSTLLRELGISHPLDPTRPEGQHTVHLTAIDGSATAALFALPAAAESAPRGVTS